MDTATYENMRQFADSWGLAYMLGIFLVVTAMLFWRGAKQQPPRQHAFHSWMTTSRLGASASDDGKAYR
jgi:cbb3-type cytochrome oxidase subunit 3